MAMPTKEARLRRRLRPVQSRARCARHAPCSRTRRCRSRRYRSGSNLDPIALAGRVHSCPTRLRHLAVCGQRSGSGPGATVAFWAGPTVGHVLANGVRLNAVPGRTPRQPTHRHRRTRPCLRQRPLSHQPGTLQRTPEGPTARATWRGRIPWSSPDRVVRREATVRSGRLRSADPPKLPHLAGDAGVTPPIAPDGRRR